MDREGNSRREMLVTLKSTAIVALGTVILAFGTAVFQIPFDLISGGMSGIAITLANAFDVAFLTEDIYITVMTWGLFLIGLVGLGKSFAMKTLVSTVVYPLAFYLCGLLVSPDVLGGLFYLRGSEHGDAALVIAAVFGGIIIGVGCGVAFLGGGSTGGVDIIALAISKRFRRIKSAHALLAIDAAVILVGALVIDDPVTSLLGVVSAFVSSIMIDRIFSHGTKAFVANVISDRYKEINDAVIGEYGRTTTVIDCVGGFSGENKKMLSISFNMSQYSGILTSILRIDRSAFITVQSAHEINGEGWTWEQNGRAFQKTDVQERESAETAFSELAEGMPSDTVTDARGENPECDK